MTDWHPEALRRDGGLCGPEMRPVIARGGSRQLQFMTNYTGSGDNEPSQGGAMVAATLRQSGSSTG
jgi:hypothetical protein